LLASKLLLKAGALLTLRKLKLQSHLLRIDFSKKSHCSLSCSGFFIDSFKN